MDGSCQHKAICRCHGASEIAESVKNKIELCIQKYMSLQETADYLKENHQISHNLTKTIWEQLRKENPDFFNNYYFRCKTVTQTKKLNSLLTKQLALMKQYGFFDTFDASRTSNTETMDTQLNGSFTGRPTSVSQLPIPNDQYPWSTYNLGAPTMAAAATDFAYGYPGLPAYTPAATTQWPSYADLSIAATMQQDPSTFGFRGDTGHNGLRTQYTNVESAAQLFLHPDAIRGLEETYQPHYGGSNGQQNGGGNNRFHYGEGSSGLQNEGGSNRFHYGEGSSWLQKGGSSGLQNGEGSSGLQNGGRSNGFHNGEGSNRMQNGGGSNMFHCGEGSNMMQNGGGSKRFLNGGVSNDQQLCHNFGTNQSLRLHTSVDQQVAGGINRHHPESVASNNPDIGDGTLTTGKKQHDFQNGGGSNGLQNGGSMDQQLCHNSGTIQSLRLHTIVDQPQELGVKRHHPESEALSNPCIGDVTLKTPKKQRRIQIKEQRRSLKKKEAYQSEETKEICKE